MANINILKENTKIVCTLNKEDEIIKEIESNLINWLYNDLSLIIFKICNSYTFYEEIGYDETTWQRLYGNQQIGCNPYECDKLSDFLQLHVSEKENQPYAVKTPIHHINKNLKRVSNCKEFKDFIHKYLETHPEINYSFKRISLGKKRNKVLKNAGFKINELPLMMDKNDYLEPLCREVDRIIEISKFLNTCHDIDFVELYLNGAKLSNITENLPQPLDYVSYNENDKEYIIKLIKDKEDFLFAEERFQNINIHNTQVYKQIETVKTTLSFLKEKKNIVSKTKLLNVIKDLQESIIACYTLPLSLNKLIEKSEYDATKKKYKKLKTEILEVKEKKLQLFFEKFAEYTAVLYRVENIPAKVEEIYRYKETLSHIFIHSIKDIFDNLYVSASIKEEISKLINFNPKFDYPEARKIKRHFIIHSGGTNTGKTYNSIQRLIEASSGVYLAPLRLLALENQEKLLENGVQCSLSTGEEEDIVENETHISSTVEKANFNEVYEVCVIDECQMITDRDRGWAWTQAILGILSTEIHLCTAPHAVELLVKIIEDCGDTYEIIEHERVTPLLMDKEHFRELTDVKPGDALICFSKKQVLNVAAVLSKSGKNCSIIYGALPYETRKRQFNRFLNKEADIVVSTDAIAMGLNLPIKRIVFLETTKFDGHERRDLTVEEIKQIAGRAGRRGIYEKGYVNSVEHKKLINNALTSKTPVLTKAKINFPNSLINIDKDLIETVKVWATMSDYDFYEKTDIYRLIYILNQLEEFPQLSKEEKLRLASIPFTETEEDLLHTWKAYIRKYIDEETVLPKPKKGKLVGKLIDVLEDYYKQLDLYFSFGKNMNMEIDKEWLKEEKLKVATQINEELVKDLEKYSRKCKRCGKVLPWNSFYSLCDKCYWSNSSHYDFYY